MNKEWSEQNKRMQSLIKKADTFEQGTPHGFQGENKRTAFGNQPRAVQ